MESIIDFINCNEPVVSSKATQIQELFDSLENGSITKSECEELIGDIININRIISNIDEIEKREKIIKLCNGLISIAKLVLSKL
jgi:hypothetical protein